MILDVPENIHEKQVYLALPARSPGVMEVDTANDAKSLARYTSEEVDVRDSNTGFEGSARVQIGKLHMRLLQLAPDNNVPGTGRCANRRVARR